MFVEDEDTCHDVNLVVNIFMIHDWSSVETRPLAFITRRRPGDFGRAEKWKGILRFPLVGWDDFGQETS
jgi:hypothetical protein